MGEGEKGWIGKRVGTGRGRQGKRKGGDGSEEGGEGRGGEVRGTGREKLGHNRYSDQVCATDHHRRIVARANALFCPKISQGLGYLRS
jgi:hypothetical protein